MLDAPCTARSGEEAMSATIAVPVWLLVVIAALAV